MREQVIASRGTKSAGVGNRRAVPAAQRPSARRGRESARSSKWGKAREMLPLVAKIVLGVIIVLFIITGYRAAASASFFRLRRIDVNGTARVSADDVRAAARRAAASSNVWRCDLEAISGEVERLPFVRKAIVSRVLPSDLRVRVVERTPLAVVRSASGRFLWVDEDAVVLGALAPADATQSFFLRGWDEAATDAARSQNRERIELFRRMSAEWEERNLTLRVSEVDLTDVRDVRAQLAGDDAQIEVRLGRENFGKRLARALKELDSARGTLGENAITYLDASLDGRTIIGLSSGASQIAGANSAAVEAVQTPVVAPSKPEVRRAGVGSEVKKPKSEAKRDETNRADERKPARNSAERKQADERSARRRGDDRQEARRNSPRNANGSNVNARSPAQERPRRVGR